MVFEQKCVHNHPIMIKKNQAPPMTVEGHYRISIRPAPSESELYFKYIFFLTFYSSKNPGKKMYHSFPKKYENLDTKTDNSKK